MSSITQDLARLKEAAEKDRVSRAKEAKVQRKGDKWEMGEDQYGEDAMIPIDRGRIPDELKPYYANEFAQVLYKHKLSPLDFVEMVLRLDRQAAFVDPLNIENALDALHDRVSGVADDVDQSDLRARKMVQEEFGVMQKKLTDALASIEKLQGELREAIERQDQRIEQFNPDFGRF